MAKNGNVLRRWRKRMGWTQAHAAHALDISLRIYQGWEAQTDPLRKRTLLAAAAIEKGVAAIS